MAYQSVNPYNGEFLESFEEIGDAGLETALDTAADCYASWSQIPFAGRALVAYKAAALLRHKVDDFARPVTLEMGKLIAESRAEVLLSAEILE